MDGKERLRRYLEQRRETGERELVLDAMTVDDVMRIVGAQAGAPTARPFPRSPTRRRQRAATGAPSSQRRRSATWRSLAPRRLRSTPRRDVADRPRPRPRLTGVAADVGAVEAPRRTRRRPRIRRPRIRRPRRVWPAGICRRARHRASCLAAPSRHTSRWMRWRERSPSARAAPCTAPRPILCRARDRPWRSWYASAKRPGRPRTRPAGRSSARRGSFSTRFWRRFSSDAKTSSSAMC